MPVGPQRLDYLFGLGPDELDALLSTVEVTELLEGMSAEEIARFLESLPEDAKDQLVLQMQEQGMLDDLSPHEVATALSTMTPEEKARMLR